MAQKLAGKVAVVTGASKGIGASIALHLAAEGAAVVMLLDFELSEKWEHRPTHRQPAEPDAYRQSDRQGDERRVEETERERQESRRGEAQP